MDLLEAVRGRRSIRRFLKKPVPRELIEKLIKECTWAPSAMNTQPWYFYVLEGEARDKLVEVCSKAFYSILPRLRELGFPERHIEFIKWYFFTFGNAPVIIVVYTDRIKEEVYQIGAIESCAAAIQNLLLLAYAEGLGTCWMTGPLWIEDEINRFLGVEDKVLVALITVGYPEKIPRPPPRKEPFIKWVTEVPK